MSQEDTSESVTEIEFTFRDESYPIVNISAELECRIELLEAVQPPEDDGLIEFFQVDDDRPTRVVEAGRACDRTDDVEILGAGSGVTLVELAVSDCVAQSVAKADAILRGGYVDCGECQFTVYLPPTRDANTVVETIRDEHPSVTVASVRERPVAEPFLTQQRFQQRLRDTLTNRQWQVLRLAHSEGYFERPREAPQSELAEQIDISQETVSQHLRAAQRRLLSVVFDDGFQ